MAEPQPTKEQANDRQPKPNGQEKESAASVPESKPEQPKKRSPFVLIAVALVAVLAVFFGVRFWLWSRNHVSTDDAYVTGDLVNVSPLISGTLQSLTVQEGDFVKRGQLIARLDPSGPEASLRQAKANYAAAETQIPESEKNLTYEQLAMKAQVEKAQSGVASQQAKTTGARAEVTLTAATVQNQVRQGEAQVAAAQAQWDQAKAQVVSAELSAADPNCAEGSPGGAGLRAVVSGFGQ